MLKIRKIIYKFKRKKDVDYYAGIYRYKVKDCTITKLKSNKPLETYCVILINKGNKDANKDWLSYRGSYDMAICLNKDLKIIKIYTNLVFDVSFFADGEKIEYKNPRDIILNNELLDLLKNSSETLVWDD